MRTLLNGTFEINIEFPVSKKLVTAIDGVLYEPTANERDLYEAEISSAKRRTSIHQMPESIRHKEDANLEMMRQIVEDETRQFRKSL